MIRVVIIDDEKAVRNVIRQLLLKFFQDIEIIGEADTVDSGYKLLIQQKVDLVFLDIELSGGKGFDILTKLQSFPFKVIFITAYDQYAIQAIKVNALDYILKPIQSNELFEAIEKFRTTKVEFQDIGRLLASLRSNNADYKIAIYSLGKITYLDKVQIVRCQSEGSYTHVFVANGDEILSSKSIKYYENLLENDRFYRLNRSHLINLDMVLEYKKKNRDEVLMKDGGVITVSRRHRRGFLEAMAAVYEN